MISNRTRMPAYFGALSLLLAAYCAAAIACCSGHDFIGQAVSAAWCCCCARKYHEKYFPNLIYAMADFQVCVQ